MFETRLILALAKFNKAKALDLSDGIHRAESAGYELTDEEDKLWKDLTLKIEGSLCCCEGKDWNCSDLPGCVTQEEWNNLYLVARCDK